MSTTAPAAPASAVPITWIVTGIVSAAGVVMSASQLVDLAILAGWGPFTAWLLPVLLDGSGIAGGMACRYGPTPAARRYGLGVLIESAGLSVFGNVAAHLIPAHPPAWVMVVVAVAVPLQIVLTVHMAMLLADRSDSAAPDSETSQPTGETPAVVTETTPQPAPVEPGPSAPSALSAETAEPAGETPAAETETPDRNTETLTETDRRNTDTRTEAAPASELGVLDIVHGPAPDGETSEDETETPRRVVPFRRAEESTTEPTLIERSPYTGDEPEGPQAAMWRVFCAHRQAGTDHELNATQLSQEAGQGSRQIAGRYLAKWREQEPAV